MATLYHHLPSFHYLLSPPKITSPFHPTSSPNRRHNSHYSTISASLVKKSPRASRKPKSDEELCNDIKCFLSSVGLPQNHVPTMKELSLYGRQDLANIVRRRGYKYIRQLLETSSTENIIGSDTDTSQFGNPEILGENDMKNVLFVGVPSDLTKEEDTNSFIGEDEGLQINDQSSLAADSLSLQEKVAKFIQLGELDASEDGEGSTSDEKGDEEGKTTESENSNEPEFALSMLNGISTASALKVEDPALETITSRNSNISTEEQRNTSGEDMDDEKAENQSYINHLRFLLYEKERELAQLKEQIEKEKLALSLLHSKAEEEISNAHELISEKETELHEAEEIFSGLTEVEIQYSGEAETVELAGSFNGWHQKIPMELQSTSSSVTYPTESSTSQDWRVVLWLYPGVYEIKFVVNGDWKIDPERETVSRNGVHNNILRVDSVDDPANL
ncbi:protein PTST homolog 3, chloroplastic-like isoform X2 [Salvia splendens]|uniref:protein PTST homolog 3, chloroplastic-like isoform X2 n=1 Tax=Salvia splendens TaxID=180675 RepID=UPI001C25EFC3|nr:protein PTST homolog 3, chloroplastic-like isoform X2 [Salvia splendens]